MLQKKEVCEHIIKKLNTNNAIISTLSVES